MSRCGGSRYETLDDLKTPARADEPPLEIQAVEEGAFSC